jgi:hypothetical protein
VRVERDWDDLRTRAALSGGRMAERKNLTNRALRKRFRLQAFNRIVNLGAYSRAVVALVSPALRLHPRCFLRARDKYDTSAGKSSQEPKVPVRV